MSTHISAEPGTIAPTVLLPGDPLRAKWIAENFFENPVQHNAVRNMFGFTGTYRGNPVSVQGTGMGVPSISIYVNELFDFYGVQTAIRVGTCGGLRGTKLRDVVIAMAASTDSGVNQRALGGLHFSPTADFSLLESAVAAARRHRVDIHVGGVATMDLFYDDSDALKRFERLGVLAVEMETSGLYTLAAKYGRRALTIATVSDMIDPHEATSAEERETGFRAMVEIALEAAFPDAEAPCC
jgi:purine-nucleoside phosphorylase